jgi:hypothetical protein
MLGSWLALYTSSTGNASAQYPPLPLMCCCVMNAGGREVISAA